MKYKYTEPVVLSHLSLRDSPDGSRCFQIGYQEPGAGEVRLQWYGRVIVTAPIYPYGGGNGHGDLSLEIEMRRGYNGFRAFIKSGKPDTPTYPKSQILF